VVAELSGLIVPRAGVAQRKLIGVDPVALPFSVIDPPDGTVYGPPVFATGALQTTAGLMVTVVDTGAENRPAAFAAVTVTVMFVAVVTPDGAVKVTFAEVAPVELMARFSRAGEPDWLTDQVNGVAGGLLGSDPLTAKLLPEPESTAWFGMGLTVGASAALTETVLVAVEVPQAFVAVKDRFTVVAVDVCGAVKFGLATLALSNEPAFAVHA
jgi:hypothetical protein